MMQYLKMFSIRTCVIFNCDAAGRISPNVVTGGKTSSLMRLCSSEQADDEPPSSSVCDQEGDLKCFMVTRVASLLQFKM